MRRKKLNRILASILSMLILISGLAVSATETLPVNEGQLADETSSDSEPLPETESVSGNELITNDELPVDEAVSADEIMTGIEAMSILIFGQDPSPDLVSATSSFSVGDDVTAYFYADTGFLYVKGTGEIDLKGKHTRDAHALYPIRGEIRSVYIADGITGIGRYFLYDNMIANNIGVGITEIRLPETLTWIGERAFQRLEDLTTINMPDSLTHIDNQAFIYNTKMAVTRFPANLISIGDSAFNDTKAVTATELPDTVTHIGSNAFFASSITISKIPDGVTVLNEGAFALCNNITSIDLNNVTVIADARSTTYSAFSSRLESVKGNNLEYIGDYAFAGTTRLRNVDAPKVTYLGRQAFGISLAPQYVPGSSSTVSHTETFFSVSNYNDVFPLLTADNIGEYALMMRILVEDRLNTSDGILFGTSYIYAFPGHEVPSPDRFWSTPNYTGFTYTGNHTTGTSEFTADGSASPSVIYRFYKEIDVAVNYLPNNATSGTVPVDEKIYNVGHTVTVKENSGDLRRSGFTFHGWNTTSSGSGTNYAGGDTFNVLNTSTINLHARWRTRVESFRTLTGIDVSYSHSRQRAGTEIHMSALTVTGIYTVTFDNGEETAGVRGSTIPVSDVSFNSYVMGDSEVSHFTVTHTPSGFKANFSVNRTDALWIELYRISATWNGEALEVGSPIDKADVTVIPTYRHAWPDGTFSYENGSASDSNTFAAYPNTIINDGMNTLAIVYTESGKREVDLINVRGFVTEVKPEVSITYRANGANSGEAPIDENTYPVGGVLTVKGNDGNIKRNGYTFNGWNTKENGTGLSYVAGDAINIEDENHVNLYAKWKPRIETDRTISGISVSYNLKIQRAGTEINLADLSVVGIYTITYDNGEEITDVRGNSIPHNQISLNSNVMGEADVSNFTVTHTPSGHEGYFSVVRAEIEKTELNHITASYGGGNIEVGKKVAKTDISVIPAYRLTWQDKTVTYIDGDAVNPANFAIHPDTITNEGANTLAVTYSENGKRAFDQISVTGFIIEIEPEKSEISVTYHPNGASYGTVPMDAGIYHIGDKATVKGNSGNLARNGYTFAGWNVWPSGNGVNYASGDVINITNANPINLYARWKPRTEASRTLTGITATYNLTRQRAGTEINLEELSVTGIYTIKYDNGEEMPDVTGNAIPISEISLNSNIIGDMDITNFTVTHTPSGYEDYFSVVRAEIEKTELSHITASYGGGNIEVGKKVAKTDISVIPTYRLTWQDKTVTYIDGDAIKSVNFAIHPDIITNEGANTLAVTYSENGKRTFDQISVTGFITEAEPEKPEISVTYHPNGASYGTVPVDAGIYYIGDKATVKDNSGNLARSGYTFAGWNVWRSGNGINYASGDVINIINASQINLYAKWKPRTEADRMLTGITVTYNQTKQRAGTEINLEELSVTGIYTIEYDNGEEMPDVVGNVIPISEISLDSSIVGDTDKSNITVTHTPSGHEGYFSVTRAGIEKTELSHITAIYHGEKVEIGIAINKADISVTPTYRHTWEDKSVTATDGKAISANTYAAYPDIISKEGTNTVAILYSEENKNVFDLVNINGFAKEAESDDPDDPTPSPTPTPAPTSKPGNDTPDIPEPEAEGYPQPTTGGGTLADSPVESDDDNQQTVFITALPDLAECCGPDPAVSELAESLPNTEYCGCDSVDYPAEPCDICNLGELVTAVPGMDEHDGHENNIAKIIAWIIVILFIIAVIYAIWKYLTKGNTKE